MKIRIMIQDYEVLRGQTPGEASARQGHACVWSGDIEILKDNVYITKLSILADGEPQPICDIPFSLNKGYYMWIPPATETDIQEDFREFALINPDIVSPYPKGLINAKYGKEPITLEDTSKLQEDPGEGE